MEKGESLGRSMADVHKSYVFKKNFKVFEGSNRLSLLKKGEKLGRLCLRNSVNFSGMVIKGKKGFKGLKGGSGLELSGNLMIREKFSAGLYSDTLELIENVSGGNRSNEILSMEGICYFKIGEYVKAAGILGSIEASQMVCAEEVYIFLIKALEKCQKVQESEQVLSKSLKFYPKSKNLLKLSANTLFKNKKYSQVIKLLKKFSNPHSLFLVSESYRKQKKYKKSLQYAEKLPPFSSPQSCILGKIHYSLKSYSNSLKLLSKIPNSSKYFIEASYYLGKTHNFLSNHELSELSLESVCQTPLNPWSIRSLYKLTELKLSFNDFYGAFHSIQRLSHKLTSPKKVRIEKFAYCGYSIVQHLNIEAIERLTELIGAENNTEYLKIFLILRGFCYFAAGQYIEAIKDYNTVKEIGILDLASSTNLCLAEAVCCYAQGEYEKTLDLLKSSKLNNKNALVVETLCKVYLGKFDNYLMYDKLRTKLKGVKGDEEVLRVQALLLFLSRRFPEALKTVKKCYKFLQSNNKLVRIIESFTYMSLQRYKEAYNILVSIDLDQRETFALYPYRVICAFYAGEKNSALFDIKKMIEPNSPNALLMATYLSLIVGDRQEALSLTSKLNKNVEVSLLMAHCYLASFQLDQCINCLQELGSGCYLNDFTIVQGLMDKKLVVTKPGAIFDLKHTMWIEGIYLLDNGMAEKAVEVFENLKKIVFESQGEVFFKDSPEYLCEYSMVIYNLAICELVRNSKVRVRKGSVDRAFAYLKHVTRIQSSLLAEYVLLYCLSISQKCERKSEKFLNKIEKISNSFLVRIFNNEQILIYPEYADPKLQLYCKPHPLPTQNNILIQAIFSLPSLHPPLSYQDTCNTLTNIYKSHPPNPTPEVPWLQKSGSNYCFTRT